MQQQQSNKKSRGGRILARKVATKSTSRAKGLGFHREKSLRSGNVFIGNQRLLTCINNFPSSVPESFRCHIYCLCCWWWWSLSHEQPNKSCELEDSCQHPELKGKQLSLVRKDKHNFQEPWNPQLTRPRHGLVLPSTDLRPHGSSPQSQVIANESLSLCRRCFQTTNLSTGNLSQ